MKLRLSAGLLLVVFFLSTGLARAAHSVRGIVITADGAVVPAFMLTVKPEGDGPELIQRQHLKNGEFTVDNLKTGKYWLEVSAPLYIPLRMDLEFNPADKDTDYNIVVLHGFRNEPRFVPSYTVSITALQQRVPNSAREAYLRAAKLHREGELSKAIIEYGAAIRLYPKYVQALHDLGTIFLLYNRPLPALAFLRRAQDIEDSNPIINANIAIAMVQQGDYPGALKLLEKALREQPGMGLAHYYMAKIYCLQKKYAQAKQSAQEAVANDPRLLDGWILLVKVNHELQDQVAVRDALAHLRDTMSDKLISSFINEELSTLASAG